MLIKYRSGSLLNMDAEKASSSVHCYRPHYAALTSRKPARSDRSVLSRAVMPPYPARGRGAAAVPLLGTGTRSRSRTAVCSHPAPGTPRSPLPSPVLARGARPAGW